MIFSTLVPASMSILPLHLEYTSADPALSDIQLELSQEQAFNILDMVPQDLFYDSFSKHIRNTTGIVLSSIVLRRVSTSLASMRNDGLLKVMKKNMRFSCWKLY
jgi:hypothetical protein